MNCPKCNCQCDRDSVDVGVGMIYGPWGCQSCGWSEDSRYDSSGGPSPAQQEAGPEWYVDSTGGMQRVSSITDKCERFGIPRDVVEEAFSDGKKGTPP